MNNLLDEKLNRVAEEVFESLAFVLAAFEEDQPAEAKPAEATAASIAFSGPFQGTLFLRVSSAMLPAISANMLGLDFGEEPPRDTQLDAFKELLNVVCGNLLPLLAGEQAIFDVHPAELIENAAIPATVAGHEPLSAAKLDLEGGQAELALFAPETATICIQAGA